MPFVPSLSSLQIAPGHNPQSKKCRVVARSAAPLERDAVLVCKQHTTANSPDRGMEPVETRLGHMDQQLCFLPSPPELGIRKSLGKVPPGRIKFVETCRPLPGRNQSGFRCAIGRDRRLDSLRMAGNPIDRHSLLPKSGITVVGLVVSRHELPVRITFNSAEIDLLCLSHSCFGEKQSGPSSVTRGAFPSALPPSLLQFLSYSSSEKGLCVGSISGRVKATTVK